MAGNVTPGDAPGYPITITKPGSYVLTGNMGVPYNVNAIVLDAENVVLDLNGFETRSMGVCERNASTGVVLCDLVSLSDGPRVHNNNHHGLLAMGAGNGVTNSHLAMHRQSGLYGVSVLIDKEQGCRYPGSSSHHGRPVFARCRWDCRASLPTTTRDASSRNGEVRRAFCLVRQLPGRRSQLASPNVSH